MLAGRVYMQAPRCLSRMLTGQRVAGKWRLFGGDEEGYSYRKPNPDIT
jgi:hypothetical protein